MKGRQPQKPVCHASKLSSYRIGHHILSAFVQFATMQSRAKLWWRMPAYSLFFKTRAYPMAVPAGENGLPRRGIIGNAHSLMSEPLTRGHSELRCYRKPSAARSVGLWSLHLMVGSAIIPVFHAVGCGIRFMEPGLLKTKLRKRSM